MDITLHLPRELEHKLREKALDEGVSVASYIVQTLESQVNMPNSLLTHTKAQEAELVKKIILKKLSPEFWKEYKLLSDKADAEDLSKKEYKRLIELNNEKEETTATIIGLSKQLAKLRGTSLRSVMEELGIQPV